MPSSLPVKWEPPASPGNPSKLPGDLISAVVGDPLEKVKFVLETGTSVYKDYHEAQAASQKAAVLKTVNNKVPALADDAHNLLDSGTECNKTMTQSVRKITDHFERMTNAHVGCADKLQQNANNINAAISSSSKSVSEAADSVKKAAEEIAPEFHGVRLMVKSLSISVAAIAVIMEQLLDEVKQVNRNLEDIREELWRKNVLTSSGGAGNRGFAEVVYNFVDMEAGRAQYKNDAFFVWHPDTSWHPAFYAKVKDAPLSGSFLGESDCLDRLCVAMKAIRQAMREQGTGNDAGEVTFHILIPSWYNITFADPVHFPDELLPLRLVGPKHNGGKSLVSFVLPRPQRALTLQGVANIFEERPFDRETAETLGMATLMSSAVGGSGAGVVLTEVTLAGLGLVASPWVGLVALPLFFGGGITGWFAGLSMGERLVENWSHKRTRVLGSLVELPPESEGGNS